MIEHNGEKWYKPSEIAKLELIKNTIGKGDYRFVVRMIKSGKLKAETWNSSGSKPYFIVSDSEIDNYNNTRFGA